MKRKIAVPADDNGFLEGHFGHSTYFYFFETIESQILSVVKITPPPHKPGVLPKWLRENSITDVIAGGIGERALKILNHFKIAVYKGAPVLHVNELVQSFLNGTLELNDNNCDKGHEHHEHHHHHHQHHQNLNHH